MPAVAHAQLQPRLANTSIRASGGGSGIGPDALSINFMIEGATPKPILIRAVGPSLAALGVTGALADPILTVYDRAGLVVASNDNWSSTPALVTAFGAVGAFPLLAGSRDAVLLVSFNPGTYTATVSGAGGATGEVLLEVYETDATARLVYLATRSRIRGAGDAASSSFTLGGSGTTGSSPMTIRALGPALTAAGLTGALADPNLLIFSGPAVAATAANDNWGGNPTLSSAAITGGLMPLAITSNDSTLLQLLSAGGHTARVTGMNGSTGVFIVEISQTDASRAASFLPALLVPLSPVSAAAGGTATFSAVAVGKPQPTYQWRKNGGNLVGATSAALALTNLQISDAGDYSVVLTNSAGTTVSVPAALSVSATPGPVAYAFSTIAGQASVGNTDATGIAARFNRPAGLAIDGAGNLYVADTYNHVVRKISPSGVVTTLAGSGHAGSVDGPGAAAEFRAPYDIAVDAGGTVYVSGDDAKLRRISPAGDVTSMGGAAGIWAAVTGEENMAPGALAVDGAGNLFAISFDMHALLKVAPNGVVSILAGKWDEPGSADGTGSAARFGRATGIAFDRANNTLYVNDENGVRRITAAGVVTTVVARRTPRLSGGLTIDSGGNIFVADTGNPTVLKIDPSGAATVIAGLANSQGATDGTGSAARFREPRGIVVDASGAIYVTDYGNTVRRITTAGVVTTLAGLPESPSSGVPQSGSSASADGVGLNARFFGPSSVAVDRTGNLFVADSGNATIRRITPTGVVSTLAGSPGLRGVVNGSGLSARFQRPTGVAVDSAGNVFVVDPQANNVRRVTPTGVVTTVAGTTGAGGAIDGIGGAARFSGPEAIAIDAADNLYVSDTGNSTVRKITPAGAVTTLAGSAGRTGTEDGTGSTARFNRQRGVAVDSTGIVYVADTGNNTIRRITPAGVVTTLAGFVDAFGFGDGTGASARFAGPWGIAVDRAGNVFVCEYGAIRLISPAGVVKTVAGDSGGTTGSADGTGTAARFSSAAGIAVDASGVIYVADGNGTIRRGVASSVSLGVRMGNLSVRTTAGAGAQTLIVGFVVADGSKSLLIRGIGPALVQFGLTGALADPELGLFSGATRIASNNDWGTAANAAQVASVTASLGGFALTAGSKDAALFTTVGVGAYTAQLSGADGGTGVALVELYDADAASSARFFNASARAEVGTGAGVLIAGFTVAGNTPKTILVRGVGPTLSTFGVTGVLVDPQLKVFRGDSKIDENDDWGQSAGAGGQLATAAAQVGAFALTGGSKDSALLLSLRPGSYTAQLSGTNATTGVALVEVYEVP